MEKVIQILLKDLLQQQKKHAVSKLTSIGIREVS